MTKLTPLLDPAGLRARLAGTHSTIASILRPSATVGLTYGIAIGANTNTPVFVDNFGFRDLAHGLPTDEDTVYPLCSVTKSLVSTVLGILVDEKLFGWDDRVADLLPGYAPQDEKLKDLTLGDWLSMRSGAQGYEFGFCMADNAIYFPKRDSLKIINSLKSVDRPGVNFQYNNWGYEVAALVIKAKTGRGWDELLHERVLTPLGIERVDATGTLVADETGDDNLTKQYQVLSNGEPVEIGAMRMTGRTIWGGAGGVHGSLRGVLKLYHSILHAAMDEFNFPAKTPLRPNASTLHNLQHTMSAHAVMDHPPTLHETSYGYGWMRAELPGFRLKQGPNFDLVGLGPELLRGETPRLTAGHPGAIAGANSAVALFPGPTPVTIVVLSNTTGPGDSLSWVVDHVIQTVFAAKVPNDYVLWSTRAAEEQKKCYGRLVDELQEIRATEKKKNREVAKVGAARPLEEYVGVYVNEPEFLRIDVKRKRDGDLQMRLQDLENQTFALNHFEGDVFCWLMGEDELARRGMSALVWAELFLVRFVVEDGAVKRLTWCNDAAIPEGEVLLRK